MMATIKQHIPNFVSGFDPEVHEFSTLDELLNLSFIKRWVENNHDFYRFSVDEEDGFLFFMAEFDEGRRWWVVGYITGTTMDELGLPQWKPNKEEKE